MISLDSGSNNGMKSTGIGVRKYPEKLKGILIPNKYFAL